MKISELIEQLEEKKQTYGDIVVKVYDGMDPAEYDNITQIEFRNDAFIDYSRGYAVNMTPGCKNYLLLLP